MVDGYDRLIISEEQLIELKCGYFADCLMYNYVFSLLFSKNRNYEKAIEYINNFFSYIFIEAEREHNLYEYMKDYINENSTLDDIIEVDSILDALDELFIRRCEYYAGFVNNIDRVVESKILTNMNYLYYKFPEFLSEEVEDQLKILLKK